MHALRQRLWHLDAGVAHLDQGSYGAVPIPALEAQARVARAVEPNPDRFCRADPGPDPEAARRAVASLRGVAPDATALVQSAGEAVQVAPEAVAPGSGRVVVLTAHGR